MPNQTITVDGDITYNLNGGTGTMTASNITATSKGTFGTMLIGGGTTQPATLTVNSGGNMTLSYGYINSSAAVSTTSGTNLYSIYTQNRIACSELNVYSDNRIKKNVVSLNDSQSLQTLSLLRPVSYNFIDNVKYTQKQRLGFIAQEVDQLLPNIIDKNRNILPNIYTTMPVQINTETKTLTLQLTDVQVADIINGGGLLQIAFETTNGDEYTTLTTIQSTANPGEVLINIQDYWNMKLDITQIFVYGYQVTDMHVIHNDSLLALVCSAVQNLDKRLQAIESRLNIQ